MNILQDILTALRWGEAGPLEPFPEGINQYGLSVSSTVVTLSVPDGAIYADAYVRTNSVVFTRDRSAPTATRGLQADATDVIMLDSRAKLLGFRVIRASADATMDVEYFRKSAS